MASRNRQGGLAAMAFFSFLALALLRSPPLQRSSEESKYALGPGASTAEPILEITGTASCSARACHGGLGPDLSIDKQTVRLNEYTKWAAHDKHAKAYSVLFEDQSKKIAGNEKPFEDPQCLACHTHPLAALKEASQLLEEERLSGVGCESCHGPAKSWLGPHTRKEWKKYTKESKRKLGMIDIGDLLVRAQVCASCHVGSPPNQLKGFPLREVTHDLIAAGHPRLNFEFRIYMAKMPPHWDETRREPGIAAKTWFVGQAATAQAALQLLQSKSAAKAIGDGWRPEFAEYDCYSCHHDLQQPSWRQRPGLSQRTAGSLSWGTWYLPMTRALMKFPQPPFQKKKAEKTLEVLVKLMQGSEPDRVQVFQTAETLAKQLQDWSQELNKTNLDRPTVRRLLLFIGDKGQELAGENWDSAAQLYLAVEALVDAQRQFKPFAEAKEESIQAAFQSVFRELSFPTDSRQNPYDSPKIFKPDKFHEELRKLLGILKPSGNE